MTTQTKVKPSTPVIQAPFQFKKSFLPVLFASCLIVLLVGAVVLARPPRDLGIAGGDSPAIAAWSARYEGLANHYAENLQKTQRSYEAWGSRYQGMADRYAAENGMISSRAIEAWSARYQGLADHNQADHEIHLNRAWSTAAMRYQAMAEDYLSAEQGLAAGWAATAERLQAIADYYESHNK